MGSSLFSFPWLCWPIKLLSNIRIIKLDSCSVSVQKQLAEGAFGTVFRVKALVDNGEIRKGERYALKQLFCQSEEQFDDARLELEALQRFKGHDHIIELLDSSNPTDGSKTFHFLFPLCARGTVWDVMMRSDVLSSQSALPWPFAEKHILYVIGCVAKALQHMHSQGYSHRDVKPHNILLSSSDGGEQKEFRELGRPLLMDLGSVAPSRCAVTNKKEALRIEEEAALKSSAAYRAPELTSVPFPPCELDERVDVWALGCSLYCMAAGRSPFESEKEGVMRLAILNGKYSLPAGAGAGAGDAVDGAAAAVSSVRSAQRTADRKGEQVKGRTSRGRGVALGPAAAALLSAMLRVDHRDRPTAGDVAASCDNLLRGDSIV